MSAGEPSRPAADDRRPLDPGARIGEQFLVLRGAGVDSAGFAYAGLRLADQANVAIVECCPAGLAARGDGGAVLAIRGWEDEFAARIAAFGARAATLRAMAHPAIEPIGAPLRAQGSLYVAHDVAATTTLDAWGAELLRRPSAVDVARIAGRLAWALAAAHGAGLGHGAVAAPAIRLSRPGDAMLCGFMLRADDASAALADARGLAGVLYGVVTGRPAPAQERDRSLDARHAALHIAAGDYPDALLAAIDAALGLDGGSDPIDAGSWLVGLVATAREMGAEVGALADRDPPPAVAEETVVATAPRALPPSPETAPPPRPARTPRTRPVLPMLAATVLVLVGVAGWLASSLLTQAPAPEAPARASVSPSASAPAPQAPAASPVSPVEPARQPAAVAPAAPAPAPQAEPPVQPLPSLRIGAASPPPAVPASPAAPPVAPPPAPDPAALIEAEIGAAVTREALMALAARGADRARVEERLAALGYVALAAGDQRVFRKPGDGEALRDCADCPELLLVPAGRVSMRLTIANAQRTISLDLPRPFAIGRHEVTRGQFAAFVTATNRRIDPGCHVRAPVWRLDPELSWREPGFAQADDHPAVCVSYEDAQAYVAWLSQRTGQRYRLPSDAEWHYLVAAEDWDRGGVDLLCAIGNGADRTAMEAHPQWSGAACRDGFVNTAPGGRFAPSLWGLHDLNGNVWEWVSTCAPEPSPDAVFPPQSCAASAPRILRGGSFADAPSLRLTDARIVSAPAIRDQVAGFRVLRE